MEEREWQKMQGTWLKESRKVHGGLQGQFCRQTIFGSTEFRTQEKIAESDCKDGESDIW